MKREILFRGKRVDNGEWVYGRGLQQCKDELGNEIVAIFKNVVKSEKYIKKEGRYTLYYVPVKAETLGQYTGLKDKNGDKIFEGDMLSQGQDLLGVVCISKRYGVSILKKTLTWSLINFVLDSDFDAGVLSDIEVRGNIYDNPELMK